MKKITLPMVALLSAFVIVSCKGDYNSYYPDISKTSSPKGTDIFKPDSASLAQSYTIPDWFTDSKLGIFIHYGVYSVPAYGNEWYAREMYTEGSKVHSYHQQKYGEVTEFGYKDFIPMFHAEEFDAAQWAAIFKGSGARYVVPVAEHHDGFSMYNSAWNSWNSVDMGPKIDFIGELAKAVKAEGMHFGLSSHRAENCWFYHEGMKFPSDVRDSDCSMYGERIERPEGEGMTCEYGRYPGSNDESRENWLKHIYELVDMYEPELIWFDWTVGRYPFQPTFYKFLAYYYNSAIDWGKEVVVNTKVGYGDNIQVFDIERGKSDIIRHFPWQTDTSIGNKSWSYTPDEENKSPNHVVDDFVDIVSKNGNLLLNVGPKMEGTITPEQASVLSNLGEWLQVNGEAIYGTRHWVRWGEGDAKSTSGFMTDGMATEYSPRDIRYTRDGNTLYAISLDWQDGAEILLKSLAQECGDDIKVTSVEMVGSSQEIQWSQTNKGLMIKFPEVAPSDYAHTFKIGYSGVVYGDIQAEVVAGRAIIEHYIHNNSDCEISTDVACYSGSLKEETKLAIAPGDMGYSKFTFDLKDGDNIFTLKVDGKPVSTKIITK